MIINIKLNSKKNKTNSITVLSDTSKKINMANLNDHIGETVEYNIDGKSLIDPVRDRYTFTSSESNNGIIKIHADKDDVHIDADKDKKTTITILLPKEFIK